MKVLYEVAFLTLEVVESPVVVLLGSVLARSQIRRNSLAQLLSSLVHLSFAG